MFRQIPTAISIAALLFAFALVGVACDGDGAPAGTPTASAFPTQAPVASAVPAAPAPLPLPTEVPALVSVPGGEGGFEPPSRDLFELSRRLNPPSGPPVARTVNPVPVTYEEGHNETFWVADLVDASSYRIDATLQVVSEHAYWYVDNDLKLERFDLENAAETFESQIHPLITGSFGDIWNPGVDNDPRLTVLHTAIRAAAGYYGSQDEFPSETHPQSNEREIIYMDGSRLRPGSPSYLGVLTHEFQHAIHWNQDSGEEAWVNEGLAEVAQEMAEGQPTFVERFLRSPDTQLNYWPADIGLSGPHYGASSLFFNYLAQHYGGYQGLSALVREQADGINGMNAYLASYGVSFVDVFKDWVIANYLDEPGGKHGYPDREVEVRGVGEITEFREYTLQLHQFAAHYLDVSLHRDDALVTFEGGTEVEQIATRCHSGRYCWWGNRGDSIDSTLTRSFDLTGVNSATLEFWVWFETEKDWDYAYVEVSTDGGKAWNILEGRHTVSDNPVGNSYGHGFTGTSGTWVQERIDLSDYAGIEVMLRFEYITDDTVYLDGFVIDDIAVPEIEFFDDAEGERFWHAAGFTRTDGILPQDFLVQVVEHSADGEVAVRDLELDDENRGRMLVEGFGSRLDHAMVVIAAVTPATHKHALYTLTVGPDE